MSVGAKATLLAAHLRERATAERFDVHPVEAAVYEEPGFRAALDCDLLFSCVDRPWGRHVLNLISFAHLIPVVDGGIHVSRNSRAKLRAADWRAHTATIGRACLECLGQYDLGEVQVERDGYLEDPSYIARLPEDHALRRKENVFAFSMSCASLQVLQALALTIAPLGLSNPGAQRYHFVGGFMANPSFDTCKPRCFFPGVTALGDSCGVVVTGVRPIRNLDSRKVSGAA